IGGLNATFANAMARPGKVGFISQSGALCTAILDWSLQAHVGFSAFVSIGSMLDVGWGDLIDYLGDDPHTQSIVIYMETIGNARAFLSAAREVALTKPIIVIKPGRMEGAAKAAASHTGSLTGSDEVLGAAFRRCGVLRVDTISDLFHTAEVLAKQPRPAGPHLTIVTNAGGPGVLAADTLITGGGQLAELSETSLTTLNTFLPAHWSHNNPVDVLGDADPERYAKAVECVAKDSGSDGLLVIVTPQAMTDPTGTAEAVKAAAQNSRKPVLASWMGGRDMAAGEAILNQSNIPTFNYPDTAARMFNYLWRYNRNLRLLYETPIFPGGGDEDAPNRSLADAIIASVRRAGRTLLTEYEAKQVLAAYGIPTVATRLATSPDEAVQTAAALGYPVVLKLHSETITHKTDVGGVQLNLTSDDEVRRAYQSIESSVGEKAGPGHFQGVTIQPMVKVEGYELILGSSLDAQFGPVLLFGTGGQLVEVYQDRALGLPPLNTTLARRMMEQTRIYAALKGVRGRPPVDLVALEGLLVRFSQLVVEQPWIQEIDINPLLASSLSPAVGHVSNVTNPSPPPPRGRGAGGEGGLVALDARIVLHPPDTARDNLPKLAIRPYPTQYVRPWTLKDGTPINIRPIRPEDEPMMVRFHEGLSARSVFLRYFHTLELSQRVEHERLTRICFIDYDRAMALVATRLNPDTGEREIIGVGRLSKGIGTDEAEFALLISDRFQGHGLGTELLRRLLQVGRNEGVGRIIAYMLPENEGMRRIAKGLGFHLHHQEGMLKAELAL
ncbi:MAG: bifunctional acetate--CoA ligase family protein/GNAT family N-acetyltransferase, partial [Chloroflexota bacterium]